MDRMLLDDRILFPGPILAGFAKLDLMRRARGLQVHGLMNRGYENIALLVSDSNGSFQLGVRFRKPHPGLIYITTVHRRLPKRSDEFGSYEDDRKEFVEQDPPNRLVLKPSRYAYIDYYRKAIHGDHSRRDRIVADMRQVEDECDRLCLAEGPVAYGKGGFAQTILPISDLVHNGGAYKLLANQAA